jgi:hypothetical protein
MGVDPCAVAEEEYGFFNKTSSGLPDRTLKKFVQKYPQKKIYIFVQV